MAKFSRAKGRAAEQQVILLAKKHGFDAERCWTLAQSSNPADRVKDIRIGPDFYQVQVSADGFERIYRELEGVRGFILSPGSRGVARRVEAH